MPDPRFLSRVPPVLRQGPFARYLAAVTISQIGSRMAMVALAFAVLEFGSASDLGIVLLAREIPIIVFLLLGGVFADRTSRRVILVACDLVKGIMQVATAGLLVTGTAEVWSIALLQAVFGVANAFSRPASTGIIRELTSDENLQDANALSHLSSSVLSIAGPAIGGIIVALGSPAAAIAIDAVTFFIAAALQASMRLEATIRGAATSILADLRAGWREFIDRRWAVAFVLSFGLFQLTYFPATAVLGPVVANDSLGGAGVWGVILAAGSAGALIGGLLALRISFGRPLIAASLVVVPAGLFVVALAPPAPPLALGVLSFIAGIGFAYGDVLWMTALQRNVPEHALSRISSFDWLGSIALNPIGYALIGPLAERIGTSTTLVIAGSVNVAVCIGVTLIPSVRAIRDVPSPLTAAVEETARA